MRLVAGLGLVLLMGCVESGLQPPTAATKPHTTEVHGQALTDDYYWLREKTNPEVIAYLEAENAYTEAMTAHTTELEETLYGEMVGRIVEDDSEVPVFHGGYYYYSRTEEGKQYRVYCRKKGNLDAEEEVLLDANAEAEGADYYRLGAMRVSPNHELLAYSTDTSGAEQYTLRVRDLATGEDLADAIPNTYYSVAWASDNKTLFYSTLDEAKRPYKLFRHELGAPHEDDALVWHEEDEKFFLRFRRAKSGEYLILSLDSKVTSEVHVLDADAPASELRVIHPREQGLEYSVEHQGSRFLILHNEDAPNFMLSAAPAGSPSKANWKTLIAHRDNVRLNGVEVFAKWLVVYEREDGLPQIRVSTPGNSQIRRVALDEEAYVVRGGDNPEYSAEELRFTYESLVTPRTVYDYAFETGEKSVKKQDEVRGGYDPSAYTTERIMATARDGVEVPVSLVYRKGVAKDGAAPMLLYGYGSYGYTRDPSFSSSRISLLDRGFVYAIAHIRGSEMLGRQWYENGKFLNKKNTFHDFIDCAKFLHEAGYSSPEKTAIQGGSAGGLLMGAVLNMSPETFGVAIAAVPFVDVMNTMLDPSIPLTVTEWEEWGNPNEKEYFDYMLSYSPYDNVADQAYPPMLVTAGLNDPRVSYWEPAKWTAKMRAMRSDDNVLLLKTEMSAGHGGPSGRYSRLQETAFQYAFVIDQLGVETGAVLSD